MNTIIKTIKTVVYSSIIGLLAINAAYANAPHAVMALEHAITASVHGNMGHAKECNNHLLKAIKHAKTSNKIHAAAHEHATEAIKHLKKAANQKGMEHTMTGVYSNEALRHAQAAEKAHADVHTHMTESLKHLNEAVKHHKAGHKDKAMKHMEEAIEHIEASL